MSTQTTPQAEANHPLKGDVIHALAHLTASIVSVDEVVDELRKRLDPVLLDSGEPDLQAVAKETPTRSPLAHDLHHQASRIIAQRLQLERVCDMLQL